MRVPGLPLEQRWFAALLCYTLAPLVVVLARRPRAIDFWWDFAMALGICAIAGFALLPLVSARWWAPRHRGTAFLRLVQSTHRQLSYVLLGFTLAHAGLLWMLEARVVEYLLPGAVAPMLAGTVALVLAVFIVCSSRYRETLRWPYAGWRTWHAGLSCLLLGLLGWHVIGAGYYYPRVPAQGTLCAFAAVPTFATWWLRRHPGPRGGRMVTAGTRVRAPRLVLAIALTWVAAAVGFGWSGATQAPPEERALCARDPCL